MWSLCSCRALNLTCKRPWFVEQFVCAVSEPPPTVHCIKPNPYQTAYSASAIDLRCRKFKALAFIEAQQLQSTSTESYYSHLHLFLVA